MHVGFKCHKKLSNHGAGYGFHMMHVSLSENLKMKIKININYSWMEILSLAICYKRSSSIQQFCFKLVKVSPIILKNPILPKGK